ncbi:rRNA adenine N-6-methyltransferase family protein [Frankia sp. Cr1]|uniref:rRNA adenine N-6-methyltransferase family protein n=1 Tax=Frankia sp. Cr1 TaxID=3073931 RepID=UPI002AD48EE3|nr:rRNA adenine N-6-methyltransferase family protein [Frankia sp. Cr1]
MNREDFIPDEIWVTGEDGFFLVPLRRDEDRQRWLELCRSDRAITIQVEDGTDRYDGKGIVPTSSSSAPWVMDRMFDILDVRAGMNILEIGAGTGYNAALLAERTRTGQVTTMEIDRAIADHARAALRRTGHPVTVITGDGVRGYPEHAPYDRLVATAAASTVPYAWIEQTRPGGRIVLPYVGTFEGALLALAVDADGTAQGRFHGEAGFMRLRNQRTDPHVWWLGEDDADVRTTRRYLDEPLNDFEAGFAVGTWLSDCTNGQIDEGGPAKTLLLSHADSQSWASLTAGTDEHEVTQYGPRRLWDELETAYDWWVAVGRPPCTRFGLTVTCDGQVFWLDRPTQVIPSR